MFHQSSIIKDINQLNIIFSKLFAYPENVYDVEWAQIENGARTKIRAKFKRGSFNTSFAEFEYTSGYENKIYYDEVLIKIISCLVGSEYYLETRDYNLLIHRKLIVE